MHVLTLKLAGVWQAWSDKPTGTVRITQDIPTKSGVIGMIANAMGRDYTDSIADLTTLSMGIRVDQQGTKLTDFQMVAQRDKTDAKPKQTTLVHKDYLQDAKFLVFLEHESLDFLKEIQQSLLHPARPPYLGRRNCPPMSLVVDSLRENTTISKELNRHAWVASKWYKKKQQNTVNLKCYTEKPSNSDTIKMTYTSKDVPLTFDPRHKRYAYRTYYRIEDVKVSNAYASNTYTDYFDAF